MQPAIWKGNNNTPASVLPTDRSGLYRAVDQVMGIDVSKDKLDCQLVDHTYRSHWSKTLPNTAAALRDLHKRTPEGVAWVVEPTGRYTDQVVRLAAQWQRPLLMAPTRAAKRFMASLQERAKCDRLDSRGLALFALTRPLRPFVPKADPIEKMDQLQSVRTKLVDTLASLRQQQKALLPYGAPFLATPIAALEAQIKALDKEIAAHVKAHEEFSCVKRLMGVPGIGKVTATAVASRLSSKDFAHADSFVAFCGLDITVRQSGRRQGQLGLTRQGDAQLRRLLYMCAQTSCRMKRSPYRDQYEREKAKGLKHTGAVCAVARKMAKLCWSLHRYGGEFDPARVYRQPKVASVCETSNDNPPADAAADRQERQQNPSQPLT